MSSQDFREGSLKISIAAAFMLCLSASPLALAQSLPSGKARGVTKDRVMQRAGAQFDRLDLNKDGILDQQEVEKDIDAALARLRASLLKRYGEADLNKDGKITREEFLAARDKWFRDVDANNDGILEQSEFRAYSRKTRALPAAQ